jgi:uncharacterized protein (TIGR03067 family)
MKSQVLLGLAVSGLLAVELQAGEAGDKTEKLEGTWLITSAEKGGKKLPEDILEKIRRTLEIRGDKYKVTILGKVQEEEGTFKTDPKKNPKTIDLMIASGADKGKTQRGIYRLEGDTLTVSVARPGVEERPGAFKTEEGSDVTVFVLKRQKETKEGK